MRALNISFTLLCEECGYAMFAKDYERKRSPGMVYWGCRTRNCINKGKLFAQQLPTVALAEHTQTEDEYEQAIFDDIMKSKTDTPS